MLKIFWDKDNIAFIGDRITSEEHSHCVIQIFLSFDKPLQLTVNGKQVNGKCIIVNKNARHNFSCDDQIRLSILIEPSSNFATELIKKINGDYLILDNDIDRIQQNAAALIDTNDRQRYIDFIQDFAEFLGVRRNSEILDERITEILEILQNCDCYDHTIENFAKRVCLSSSRLSHLFREQIGVPLKAIFYSTKLEKAVTYAFSGTNITDAAMLAGFDSPSHFAATVKKWMGMPVSASIKDSEFLKVFI